MTSRWFALGCGLVAACGRYGFVPLEDGVDAASDAAPDGPPPRFTAVYAFGDATCAMHEGALYCWGRGGDGELGDGELEDRGVPQRVALPALPIDDVVLGDATGCAVIAGEAWCWGREYDPEPAVFAIPGVVTRVALGRGFGCAIAGATTYCWGNNSRGQLGDGTHDYHDDPRPVVFVEGAFTGITAGDDHTCAATSSGIATCWGHNDNGTIGIGSVDPESVDTPAHVLPPVTTRPVIAGWHACALVAGAAYCWGRNQEGALGDGSTDDAATPRLVPMLSPVSAIAVGGSASEYDATCAVSTGELSCWGAGLNGRLGTGAADPVLSPSVVTGLAGPATTVALGYGHTCALLASGDIQCWGANQHGQLGDGTQDGSFTPVTVAATE